MDIIDIEAEQIDTKILEAMAVTQ